MSAVGICKLSNWLRASQIVVRISEVVSFMKFSKVEAGLWFGGMVIAAGVLVTSWDWLEDQKPAPALRVEVVMPGQEAFGDSD